MSDEVTNADLDLSDVSLERPLIDNQTVLCTTGNVKIEKSDDGQSQRVVIPLTLEAPVSCTKGNTLHVGFQVTDSILITPTGGLTMEIIKEKLARFQVAVLGLDRPKPFNAAECSGKRVLVAFAAEADKKDSSIIRQRVKKYIKAS